MMIDEIVGLTLGTVIILVGIFYLFFNKPNKLIHIICSVRDADKHPERIKEIEDYVKELERCGYKVHFPLRHSDVDQSDPTGSTICKTHRRKMQSCYRVDVFWDVTSKGSHFDLGMAYALHKPIHLVKVWEPDNPGKSYVKVMQEWEKEQFA